MMKHTCEVSVVQVREKQPGSLGILLFCTWVLGAFTFNIPGRAGPTDLGALDLLSLAKLASRVAVAGLLLVALMQDWNCARSGPVIRRIVPLGPFVLWAVLSTCWSPLKTVSLGHVFDLIVELLLATALAFRCRLPRDRCRLLCHLSMIMLALSITLLIVHPFSPQHSGFRFLQQGLDVSGNGLYHPASSSAAASFGITISMAAAVLWRWRWAYVHLLIGIPAHFAVILMAHSRTSVVLTVVAVGSILCFCASRYLLAAVTFALSVGAIGYLLIDPACDIAEREAGILGVYLARGQDAEQLATISGRSELWEAVWKEFETAPLCGCGYFVTSRTGKLDVWSGAANWDAHNAPLQVLVSTGIVGALLFFGGFALVIYRSVGYPGALATNRNQALFLAVVGGWYAIWAQTESAFVGKIQVESLAFYCVLGLLLGNLPDPTPREEDTLNGNALAGPRDPTS